MPNERTTPLGAEATEPKANILLVDDHPPSLLALRAILDDLGHNLVEAGSGEEALRRLLEQDFAVVLLDVRMQGMDGFETAKLIRGRRRSRHTPIVFLTAFENSRLPLEEAYALGAVDYLVKPLVPIILRAKVNGFIELFQKTEEVKQQAERLRQMERQQALDALRDREEQFHTLADSIPQLAWMARPDGHIFWYNRRWYEYTGTTPAQMVGWGWQSVHDPAELPRVLAKYKDAIASGEPWEDTFPLRRHDGQMRWHLSRALPVRDDQGRIVRWFGTNTDITDRIEMEAALKRSDRRKDEFLAMLAHELRNPLAPIRNAAQVLNLLVVNDPKLRRTCEMIDRQVGHLARLVDDLLDVSRITSGKIKLQKEAVELTAILARAVETSRPLIDARRQELTVTLPPETIPVEADATRLAQVVSNLLNNAAKYTPEGGRIRLTVEKADREAVLRVCDSGVGIPGDLLPQIFDLFTQGDRSLARSEGGLGIGLTLVKSLVEMHGGRVEAKSDGAGRGSEFAVYLPTLPSADRGGRSAESSSGPRSVLRDPQSKSRLLVVDDNADAAESLSMILRASGHQVRTAYDGPTALRAAAEFQPDVVLLDIGLPQMDGYEVARRLRGEVGLKDARLVALTGYGQEEDRRRAQEAGFDEHLTKPTDLTVLQNLLTKRRGP
ncbi:MAG TPA: response regulator [Gemmataceae bacterium]